MAKIYGMNGVATGRRGNDVFAVTNGTQIVRQYQPVVANPRTDAQLRQRAKMNTAGRFSHLCPKALLKAMQTENNRLNRAMFNKNLIEATVVGDPVSGVYTGTLQAGAVNFSRGAGYLKARVLTQFAVAGYKATIGLALAPGMVVGKYAERIVVAVLNTQANRETTEAVVYKDVAFTGTDEVSVEINLPETTVNGQRILMWRIPIDLTEEGMNIVTNVLGGTTNDITATLAATNGLVQEFGKTSYVGQLNFQLA